VQQGGHDIIEIRVCVDDYAVLAAHLGDDSLEVVLAGRQLGCAAEDLEADSARAGERDRVHTWMVNECCAHVAFAREQRDRARGDARTL
jgi:hypothetical protein